MSLSSLLSTPQAVNVPAQLPRRWPCLHEMQRPRSPAALATGCTLRDHRLSTAPQGWVSAQGAWSASAPLQARLRRPLPEEQRCLPRAGKLCLSPDNTMLQLPEDSLRRKACSCDKMHLKGCGGTRRAWISVTVQQGCHLGQPSLKQNIKQVALLQYLQRRRTAAWS